MTKEQAHLKLYGMWERGEVPSNFTEDHSEYGVALEQMMKYGEINYCEFFDVKNLNPVIYFKSNEKPDETENI
jgi:hypothetical protein